MSPEPPARPSRADRPTIADHPPGSEQPTDPHRPLALDRHPGAATPPVAAPDTRAPGRSELRDLGGVISTRWRRRDRITRRMLLVADLVGISTALLLAGVIADERSVPTALAVWAIPTLPVWAVVFKLYGLYDRDVRRISHTGIDDLTYLFHGLIVGMLLFWAWVKFVPESRFLFEEAALFGLIGLPLLVLLRSGARRLVIGTEGAERVLIAGAGATSALLVRKIVQHPEYGLTPVGRIAPLDSDFEDSLPPDATTIGVSAVPLLGTADDLERLVAGGRLERVILCRGDLDPPEVLRMADICHRYGVKVGIVPGASDAYGPSIELDEVEGVTVLGVNPPVLGRTSRWLKRSFDVTIAAAGLLVSSPILLAAAIAIPLGSRGPILYRQARVGRGGRRFMLYKLRTMDLDAEGRVDELMGGSRDPNWLILDTDPRVTRVGRFLRRTSIDELPQLWNVIRGEMSLVGPRPLQISEDARVGGRARSRLDLTPGITGLWQVLGRTSIPFDEMVKLDYSYVTNWSLWMDLRLILRTLPAVLSRRGVN